MLIFLLDFAYPASPISLLEPNREVTQPASKTPPFFIATPAYVRVDPSKCNGILDLLEFGLLPDLKGLYRCDYQPIMRYRSSYVSTMLLSDLETSNTQNNVILTFFDNAILK